MDPSKGLHLVEQATVGGCGSLGIVPWKMEISERPEPVVDVDDDNVSPARQYLARVARPAAGPVVEGPAVNPRKHRPQGSVGAGGGGGGCCCCCYVNVFPASAGMDPK